ncbi:MAG: alcohol dehydrogenase catalytic domain-containing protein [Nitrososphaerales archaeon]
MKAALVTQFSSPIKIEDFPDPQVGPLDVLVKVGVCGACYSDVKIWSKRTAVPPALPHIMGHEISGIVSSLGANVSGLKVGDRVIVYLYDTCDDCEACRKGEDNCCINQGPLLGFTRHGGFAEYVSIPSKNVFKIPDNLEMGEAALITDAVITPYHALIDRIKLRFNETVLLMGMGGLALSGLQIAKLLGARVIAVSRTDSKLEMSKKLGADHTLNANIADLPAEVKKLTGGNGADAAIDFVGTGKTIEQCLRSVRKGGRTLILSYSTEPIPINTSLLMMQIGTLQSSRGGTRQNLRDIIRLASEDKLTSVITETYPLSEINAVLQKLSNGEILGRAAIEI